MENSKQPDIFPSTTGQNIANNNSNEVVNHAAVPSISMPTGGGALRSMGDSFTMNQATGVGSYTVPLQVTPGRQASPLSLSLNYSTGTGNDIFGLGWSHSLQLQVARKSTSQLPRYQDGENVDADVFVLTGYDDLVPAFEDLGNGKRVADMVDDADFWVRRYRPRSEGHFTRIEMWTNRQDPTDSHWRTISVDNETSIYGRDPESRIYAKGVTEFSSTRIFSWLLSEQYDCHGNARRFLYKSDNDQGIEKGRAHLSGRSAETNHTKYLKRILYGNQIPFAAGESGIPSNNTWLFEIVFDYGEHDTADPKPLEERPWLSRRDPFSSYRAGFELRTNRLCRRILMFHHFSDELSCTDYLVGATELTYDETPSVSYLTSIQHIGYVLQDPHTTTVTKGDSPYLSQSLPRLQFDYTKPLTPAQMRQLSCRIPRDTRSFENFPCGMARSYQWIDLMGEGVPGVFAEQAGEWFYKQNLSPLSTSLRGGQLTSDTDKVNELDPTEVRLGPLTMISSRPSLRPNVDYSLQFMDISANGSLDLVYQDAGMQGFFRCTASSSIGESDHFGWHNFRPFDSVPLINSSSSAMRYLDLTGDGRPDLIVANDNLLVWHQSLGEQGYGPALGVFMQNHDNTSSRVLFSDFAESIHLADMSGDGLLDIVRIRNQDVCYWPNMGYGHFGSMITMDDCPTFDSDVDFSAQNLLLCDVDGSGTTDIIYFRCQQPVVHLNAAGNAFELPIHLQSLVPSNKQTAVSVIDLLGNNTSCIVWSAELPSQPGSLAIQYMDLTNGVKPHLLSKISNGVGATTEIAYAPSTKYYFEDMTAGSPWLTRLPFPVHCVDRVTKTDLVSNRTYVQRYSYHHGSYDFDERTFRGFAMVEQWDAERIELHKLQPHADNWTEEFHTPPVHSKRWYHTGMYTDHEVLSRLLVRDYHGAKDLDAAALNALYHKSICSTVKPPVTALTEQDAKQAARALGSQMLREELYTDDDSQAALLPHTITEYGHEVQLIQSSFGTPEKAVFVTRTRETLQTLYERQTTSPRIEHQIIMEVDDFGNVQKQVQISYGRTGKDRVLSELDQDIQQRTVVTYTESTFTKPITGLKNSFRSPQPFSTVVYDIKDLKPPGSRTRFDLSDFSSLLSSTADANNPCVQILDIQKQVTSATETRYRKDDLSAIITTTDLEPLLLPGATYQLCFTSDSFDQLVVANSTDQVNKQSQQDRKQATISRLRRDGGYFDLFADGRLWSRTPTLSYHPSSFATPDVELEEARRSFFNVRRATDSYGNGTVVEYDKYILTALQTRDAMGNCVTSRFDYRVLQPDMVTDENKNRVAALFDALGQVTAIAHMGKEGEKEGNSLNGLASVIPDADIERFFSDPTSTSAKLLRNASSRYVYDIHAFEKFGGQQPVRQATVHRENHASEQIDSRSMIELQYTDGFGQTLQKKHNAEPDPQGRSVERWRCSEWVILNNKGLPVQKFEPFFSSSCAYEPNIRFGVSSLILYDSIGREVATILPNKSWTKQKFSPWSLEIWDANDTVEFNPGEDEYLKPFLKFVSTSRYSPTWYEVRMENKMGEREKAAALKTKLHARTLSFQYFDATGQEFLTTSALNTTKTLCIRKFFDAAGHVVQLQDTGSRTVARYVYDKLGRIILTSSLDSGNRWVFHTASGEELIKHDDRGFQIRHEYDALRRVIATYCQNPALRQSEYKRDMTVYGETQPHAEIYNLRNKVYQHSDQSGVKRTPMWDIMGNPITEEKQLAKTYSSHIDWQQPRAVQLEEMKYVFATQYDALGRPTSSIGPDNTVKRYTYLTGGLLGSVAMNARGDKTAAGRWVWKNAVSKMQYDAYGRLISELRGNGVLVTHTYDSLTGAVSRKRSVRDGVVLQDLVITRDPSLNIMYTQRTSQLPSLGKFNNVSADSEYTYDAMYRVTESTGRENVTQTRGRPEMSGSDSLSINFKANEKAVMKRYVEKYAYDDHNNLTSISHQIEDPKYPNWSRKMTYASQNVDGVSVVGNKLFSSTVGNLSEKYSYDAHGNTTSMPHLSQMRWDCFDQLQSSASQNTNGGLPEETWYVYDSEGQRVRKVTERYRSSQSDAPRKLSEHIYLGKEFDVYREYSGNGEISKECQSTRIDADEEFMLVVEQWSGPENRSPSRLLRYQFTNDVDATSIELDEQGQEISYEEYSAFGGSTYHTVLSDAPKAYRFACKRRDKQTGLYYFGRRYYMAWLCRWLNPDPLGVVDGTNTYEYCQSNPILKSDPDGLNIQFFVNFFENIFSHRRPNWQGRSTQGSSTGGYGYHQNWTSQRGQSTWFQGAGFHKRTENTNSKSGWRSKDLTLGTPHYDLRLPVYPRASSSAFAELQLPPVAAQLAQEFDPSTESGQENIVFAAKGAAVVAVPVLVFMALEGVPPAVIQWLAREACAYGTGEAVSRGIDFLEKHEILTPEAAQTAKDVFNVYSVVSDLKEGVPNPASTAESIREIYQSLEKRIQTNASTNTNSQKTPLT